jgi:hypoxanthine phosphoribosyltransferase
MGNERIHIINIVKTPLAFFVLVALIIEALLGGLLFTTTVNTTITIVLTIVLMCVIIIMLIGVVTYLALRMPEAVGIRSAKRSDSDSQHHNTPSLADKVARLKDVLVGKNFLPDLIIGISRGGLAVAALLSKSFPGDRIIPVISLYPHPKFGNSFNHIGFRREDFNRTSNDPLNVLIIDDICYKGHTLRDAKEYVENRIDPSAFKIETAAISFYEQYSQPIAPTFYVYRPKAEIRDFSGDLEPFDKPVPKFSTGESLPG